MDDILTIPELIGIIGFLLALVLGIFEIYRYRLALQLRIREIDAQQSSSHQNHFLLLLRLTFVNPSSRGRTVYHVRASRPENATLTPTPYQYDEDYNSVIYELPIDENVSASLSLDEKLQLPLDILPHQSRSSWYAFSVEMQQQVYQVPQIHLEIAAYDISGKIIAKIDQPIELKRYTIP